MDGTTQAGYAGTPVVALDGNHATNVLVVASGTVTLKGLAIQNGLNDHHSATAAGITNRGSLTLVDTIVRANVNLAQVPYGAFAPVSAGAVYSESGAMLTLAHTTVTGNTSDFVFDSYTGGILTFGDLAVTDSPITGNTGGGILGYADVSISRTTMSGNRGAFTGSATAGNAITMTVSDSVISDNIAGIKGAHVTVTNTTVAGNGNTTDPYPQYSGAIDGVFVTVTDTTVRDNHSAGISITGIGCSVPVRPRCNGWAGDHHAHRDPRQRELGHH